MKKITLVMLVLCFMCSVIGHRVYAEDENATSSKDPSSPKILIAYFSHSGNTQNIANQINTIVGGDIFRIEPAKEYPKGYQEILAVSKKEINDNFKPALKEKVTNIEQYDIIFIGSPNWYSTIAPPVASFLSEYDLSGKKVVPFVTHGGGGRANCFTDIAQLCPDATVTNGLAIYDKELTTAKQKIMKWLKSIQLLNK